MCDCARCTAAKAKLTDGEKAAMEASIDSFFKRIESLLPETTSALVHSAMAVADGHLKDRGEVQLFALAAAYCTYWTLADTGMFEVAVLRMRERLKEATPTLMPKIREALKTGHVVLALDMPDLSAAMGATIAATSPVDPRTLN